MKSKELSTAIQQWLLIEHPTDEQVIEGAGLLRQILPGRVGLYNTILRRPQKTLPTLTMLLRRHFKHLSEGLTIAEVSKIDQEVRKTVAEGISQLSDTPPTLPQTSSPASSRGLRPDHNQLPDNIKQLWTKNAERWKKMKSLYQTCLTLPQPCDRFELLKELKENWYAYKKDMKKYDDFKVKPEKQD